MGIGYNNDLSVHGGLHWHWEGHLHATHNHAVVDTYIIKASTLCIYYLDLDIFVSLHYIARVPCHLLHKCACLLVYACMTA